MSGEPDTPESRHPDGEVPSDRRPESVADVRGEPPSSEPDTGLNETGFTGFADFGMDEAAGQQGGPQRDEDTGADFDPDDGNPAAEEEPLLDQIDFSEVTGAIGTLSSLGGLL